ncbi:MAG: hypothetical protein ACK51G_18280 [Pseudomonadota bacterium]|jgi:hypothetical protein|nr:hypothetical protein [Paracoccaceae bacterium]
MTAALHTWRRDACPLLRALASVLVSVLLVGAVLLALPVAATAQGITI